MMMFSFSLLFPVILLWQSVSCSQYLVDTTPGLSRRFDGIGGLSGGGATSKLLVNYEEPYRSQILDYLFKPNFGASLQILKVEIGGDGESTDGTESSHMHEPWDESYDRGYEWWLMVEAKKRNPGIKLYGLPWAFPGWLGDVVPYKNLNNTAMYITKWALGAKKYYNLDIDYLGIWNEKPYIRDYVMVLRDQLNRHGLNNIELVVADGSWAVSVDVRMNKTFAEAVDYIGVHYPGTDSPTIAQLTGKPLWSSEDYSTLNDDVGAGCWARILNQNYVNGFMTSTISWNLIASYYQNLPYNRCGLMTAKEPWSGHYVVESPIWVTAHTTHFVNLGWRYLQHGAGVGKLQSGGSFVSLVDPEKKQFTMIIETMSHDHSICIRPYLRPYNTKRQNATFTLKGDLTSVKELYVWSTKLNFDGKPDVLFKPLPPVELVDGRFTLDLDVDELITLTTMKRASPKLYKASPDSKPFPLPYVDDYESYPINSEAFNFVPQTGVWEVQQSKVKGHGKVNRQVVQDTPVYWCDTGPHPINIGGSYNWTNVSIQVDVYIPSVNGSKGVFVAGRVTKGGCDVKATIGIFFSLQAGSDQYRLTEDLDGKKLLVEGTMSKPLKNDQWYRLALVMGGDMAVGYLDKDILFQAQIPNINGFVGYGTSSYGLADFDNLQIQPTY